MIVPTRASSPRIRGHVAAVRRVVLSMTEISAVLFDVDGTLVDTNYLHAVTWWEAFRQYGHDVAMARIHRAIGMGSDKLLDHLLPDDRDRAIDDEIRSAHTVLYTPYWPRLKAFDGAADLLRACANRGLGVVLASSANEREMRALRHALDAEDVVTAATSRACQYRATDRRDRSRRTA